MTEHFTRKAVEYSETAIRLGIDNTIPEDMLPYWRSGLIFLELIRHGVGCPVTVNSGYRCPALNAAIPGSSQTSHHTGRTASGHYCCAFDIEIEESNAKLFRTIHWMHAEQDFKFDQLIWEYGDDLDPAWVHVGFVFGVDMRGEVMIKRVGGGYEIFGM